MRTPTRNRIFAIVLAFTMSAFLLFTAVSIGRMEAGNIAKPASPNATARLRIAHVAPFSPTLANTAVDVRLDATTTILTNFEYLSSTTYTEISSGTHFLNIREAGTENSLLFVTFVVTDGMDFTGLFHGGANGYDLEMPILVDDNSAPPGGTGRIRLSHLAPFTATLANTAVDIRTDAGMTIASNIEYGDIASSYLPVSAGQYDLQVTKAGTDEVLIDLMPITVNSGDIADLIAVGDGTHYETAVFAYPNNQLGYLLPEAANLRIAHLAPFTDTLAATAVDVRIDGVQILTAFPYLSSTTYLKVAEGQHDVKIYPTGSVTPAIEATINLTESLDFSAFAHGGAMGWPLGLKQVSDDNSPPPSGQGKLRFGNLAPYDTPLDNTRIRIRQDNGAPLWFAPIRYGEINDQYLWLNAGELDLQITDNDGQVLVDLAPFTLSEGDILDFLVVGDGVNQKLGVFGYPSDDVGGLFPKEASIFITKTPNNQMIEGGGTATFTVTVTNNGGLTLTDVTVSDPLVPDCNANFGTMAPTAENSKSCSATNVTVSFTNVATATGTVQGSTAEVSDSDEAVVTVKPKPAISIQKNPDVQTIDGGGTATFTITVKNTGAVTLTKVAVSDPLVPDCNANFGTMAPAAENSKSCSATNVAVSFTNVATATGTAQGTTDQVTDKDDATVTVKPVAGPAIGISKAPDTQTVVGGGTAEFVIGVQNTGNITLTNVTVSDPLVPDCNADFGTMGPGALKSISCSIANVTVSFTNVITVTGTVQGTVNEVTGSDTAFVIVQYYSYLPVINKP